MLWLIALRYPDFKEGIRGMTGCTATKRLYFGSTNKRMGCFDLESNKVVWNRTYDRGCDRSCITPDGKTIYAPTGWWYKGDDSGFLVINPSRADIAAFRAERKRNRASRANDRLSLLP